MVARLDPTICPEQIHSLNNVTVFQLMCVGISLTGLVEHVGTYNLQQFWGIAWALASAPLIRPWLPHAALQYLLSTEAHGLWIGHTYLKYWCLLKHLVRMILSTQFITSFIHKRFLRNRFWRQVRIRACHACEMSAPIHKQNHWKRQCTASFMPIRKRLK